MRIVILVFSIFCLLTIQLSAQNYNQKPGYLSAATLQYLNSSEKPSATIKKGSKYVYSQGEVQTYVNAFVKVSDDFDESVMTDLGVMIGTKAKDVWTIKIPTAQVNNLVNIQDGIVAIQLDQPIANNMTEARAKTNTDLVHEGTGLAQAYTGKDVVVGIIDVGFDYSHPTFYDSNIENYRIKKIWEQKATGTPPSGYNYGNEITDPMAMVDAQSDIIEHSHGTHVAGIAAGNGHGGDGADYRGVAFDSDLIFVGITPQEDQWLNTGMTDIIDGINYVFEYASSVDKPAVANLSWGCTIGPHDGTSLFSQAVNNLTGPGRIFTISAGNNGRNNIHMNKVFSEEDSVLHSFVEFDSRLTEKRTWVDVWGQSDSEFCVQLGAYQGSTEFASSIDYCTSDGVIDTFLLGSDNDTCFVSLSLVDKEYNDKAHALLDLRSNTNDAISIKVKALSGEVNVWMGYVEESTGYYGEFVRNNVSGATNGDDSMTIGEMGCTDSAITVGAYASKNAFTNISGGTVSYSNYVTTNRICPFSSKGPTTDNRMKPDITAPGMTLASALSSYDETYLPGGDSYSNVVHKYTDSSNGQDYYYGELSGTSMSAPMVAGIIALVLEANPSASPDEIKTLMADTALKDVYTSPSPIPFIWGLGKIDAHAMLLHYAPSSVKEYQSESFRFYPNPTAGWIQLEVDKPLDIEVIDVMGRQVMLAKNNRAGVSLAALKSAVYFVSVLSDGQLLATQKIIKL